MAKYLNQSGVTIFTRILNEYFSSKYSPISHTHSSSDINNLTGYDGTQVSDMIITESDTLNNALKKLYNLASSKLSSVPVSNKDSVGGVKAGKHYTTIANFTPISTDSAVTPIINSVSTNEDRYYAVETDVNGLAFVNVPWTDLQYDGSNLKLSGYINQGDSSEVIETDTVNTAISKIESNINTIKSEDKVLKISAEDASIYLSQNTGELTIKVIISNEQGNTLTLKEDGLYSAPLQWESF